MRAYTTFRRTECVRCSRNCGTVYLNMLPPLNAERCTAISERPTTTTTDDDDIEDCCSNRGSRAWTLNTINCRCVCNGKQCVVDARWMYYYGRRRWSELFYYGFWTKVNPVIPRQGTTLVLISDATDSSFLRRYFLLLLLLLFQLHVHLNKWKWEKSTSA